uniref:Uncharacterized protein n=1 Tax=Arundo donax TaxID=35708 RepID=A0A0A9DFI6_ARUDO
MLMPPTASRPPISSSVSTSEMEMPPPSLCSAVEEAPMFCCAVGKEAQLAVGCPAVTAAHPSSESMAIESGTIRSPQSS